MKKIILILVMLPALSSIQITTHSYTSIKKKNITGERAHSPVWLFKPLVADREFCLGPDDWDIIVGSRYNL
jgi:hypothetical protein